MKPNPLLFLIVGSFVVAGHMNYRRAPALSDPVLPPGASTTDPGAAPTTGATPPATTPPPTNSAPPTTGTPTGTDTTTPPLIPTNPLSFSSLPGLNTSTSTTTTSLSTSATPNPQSTSTTTLPPTSDSGTSTSTTSSTATSASATPDGASSSSVGTGTIVGLSVAGGIAVLGAVAFIIWKFTRKRFSEFDADGEEIKWPELGHESHALPTRQTGRAGVDDDGYDAAGVGDAGRHMGNYAPSTTTGEASMADLNSYNDPYAVPPLPHLDPNQSYHDDPSSYGAHYDPYHGPVPQSFNDPVAADRVVGSPAPINYGRQSPGPNNYGRQSPGPSLGYQGAGY